MVTHDEKNLDDRGQALENRGDTPRPAALDTEGTESGPSCDNGTREPESVIERGERSTLSGVGNFTDQEGRGHLGERSTETDEETGADKHAEVLRASLENGTNQDDDRAENNTSFAAKDIGYIRSQGDTAQGTNGLDGVEETQVLGRGVVEVLWGSLSIRWPSSVQSTKYSRLSSAGRTGDRSSWNRRTRSHRK